MIKEALLGGNAYRLFVGELQRYLDFARPMFAESTLPSADAARLLAANFHTIKGSAGFFGFDDIFRSAGELEKTLMGIEKGASPDWLALQATFSVLVNAASLIPPPKEASV